MTVNIRALRERCLTQCSGALAEIDKCEGNHGRADAGVKWWKLLRNAGVLRLPTYGVCEGNFPELSRSVESEQYERKSVPLT